MNVGDYCHAHRWSDKDPADPWAVGYLRAMHIFKDKTYYEIDSIARWFPHCEVITEAEGNEILSRNKLIY